LSLGLKKRESRKRGKEGVAWPRRYVVLEKRSAVKGEERKAWGEKKKRRRQGPKRVSLGDNFAPLL